MKTLLFSVLLLYPLAFCCPKACGAKPADARTRAALALAHLNPVKKEQADCGCGGVLPCSCGPNCQCGFVGKKDPRPIEWLVYEVQYNKALTQNKPLLVWVAETCPPCESKWTEFIHAHLSDYTPQGGLSYHGPGVVVARPNGDGMGMTVTAKIDGIPTQASVDAAANISRQVFRVLPQVSYVQTPQVTFMPMASGCAGGNCGVGGCAGGCCGR